MVPLAKIMIIFFLKSISPYLESTFHEVIHSIPVFRVRFRWQKLLYPHTSTRDVISCTLGQNLFISITQSSRSLDERFTSFHIRTVHFDVMRSFLSVWYYTIIFGTRETRISHFPSRILHIFVKKQMHLHSSYLTNVPSSPLLMIVLIDDIILSFSICP